MGNVTHAMYQEIWLKSNDTMAPEDVNTLGGLKKLPKPGLTY